MILHKFTCPYSLTVSKPTIPRSRSPDCSLQTISLGLWNQTSRFGICKKEKGYPEIFKMAFTMTLQITWLEPLDFWPQHIFFTDMTYRTLRKMANMVHSLATMFHNVTASNMKFNLNLWWDAGQVDKPSLTLVLAHAHRRQANDLCGNQSLLLNLITCLALSYIKTDPEARLLLNHAILSWIRI